MKMRSLITIVLGIALLNLALAAGSEAQQKETFTLKYADSMPATHIVSIQGSQYFMKRAEELTKGLVKFKFYPAEQMGKAKDLLELTRSGTADMSNMGPSYTAGKTPLSGVVELPGLATDAIVASKAFLKISQEGTLYEREFKKQGLLPLALYVTPPYNVFTTKKPVRRYEDLRGLKIRGTGYAMQQAISQTGAVPVSLPAPELFEAMQRGVLDGSLLPWYSSKAYKMEELCKYATTGCVFGSFTGIFCINEGTFRKLPEDVKKAMKQAGHETTDHLARELVAECDRVAKHWGKIGISVYHFTPDDQKLWSEKLQPVTEGWVKSMEGKGIQARPILEEYKKALKEVK